MGEPGEGTGETAPDGPYRQGPHRQAPQPHPRR